MFEAKFREPNPRLPFYIAIGVLGVFAVGTVAYFWYQLRPPPPLVNTKPVRAQEQTAAAGSDPRPAAPGALATAPAAIPGLPAAPTAAAAPAPAATPTPAAVPPVKPAPELRLTPPRPPASRALVAAAERPRAAPQVHPKVASGYAAYLGGDLAVARSDYQAALRDEDGNRDALLGLAALDVRSGRFESAEGIYLRLLQADPRDPHAQAALIALRSSRLDPLATESRVKNMLAADPEAEALHFTLGNQLAQQGRWAEAQAAYFRAFAADPENPDFAFNLAVSLDHLRQPKPALDYYRRALELAARRSTSFDVEAARSRAAQLAN